MEKQFKFTVIVSGKVEGFLVDHEHLVFDTEPEVNHEENSVKYYIKKEHAFLYYGVATDAYRNEKYFHRVLVDMDSRKVKLYIQEIPEDWKRHTMRATLLTQLLAKEEKLGVENENIVDRNRLRILRNAEKGKNTAVTLESLSNPSVVLQKIWDHLTKFCNDYTTELAIGASVMVVAAVSLTTALVLLHPSSDFCLLTNTQTQKNRLKRQKKAAKDKEKKKLEADIAAKRIELEKQAKKILKEEADKKQLQDLKDELEGKQKRDTVGSNIQKHERQRRDDYEDKYQRDVADRIREFKSDAQREDYFQDLHDEMLDRWSKGLDTWHDRQTYGDVEKNPHWLDEWRDFVEDWEDIWKDFYDGYARVHAGKPFNKITIENQSTTKKQNTLFKRLHENENALRSKYPKQTTTPLEALYTNSQIRVIRLGQRFEEKPTNKKGKSVKFSDKNEIIKPQSEKKAEPSFNKTPRRAEQKLTPQSREGPGYRSDSSSEEMDDPFEAKPMISPKIKEFKNKRYPCPGGCMWKNDSPLMIPMSAKCCKRCEQGSTPRRVPGQNREQPKSILKHNPDYTRPAQPAPVFKQASSRNPNIPIAKVMNFGATMYNKHVDNPQKIWGSIVKGKYPQGKTYWFITEHQLVKEAYVTIGDEKNRKDIFLTSLKGWVKHGVDDLAFYTLPVEDLAIPHITTWTIAVCDNQTTDGLFLSTDVNTGTPQLQTTQIQLKGGYLNHCVTTDNCYCGSALLNDQSQLIGIHMGTVGPNKNGFNNKCIPIKLRG